VLIACIGVPATGDERSTGDADRGREVFLDRELGHCLLCHQVNQLDARFQGNIGPDLSGVGDRLPIDVIRERIADPTRMNPETVMPAYTRTDNLTNVDPRYLGKPILDERQFEDLVAFVASLTQAPGDQTDG
jgi:sulfur-oxidizing protein SoxX